MGAGSTTRTTPEVCSEVKYPRALAGDAAGWLHIRPVDASSPVKIRWTFFIRGFRRLLSQRPVTIRSSTWGRQGNLKHATTAFGREQMNFAAVFSDGPSSDRQPQAGATVLARSGLVHAIEAIEDSMRVFWRNSRTTV